MWCSHKRNLRLSEEDLLHLFPPVSLRILVTRAYKIYHKYKNLSRSVQKHWPHDDKKKGKNNNKGHCKAFFITQNPKKSNLKKKFVYRNYKTFKKICFKYRLRERLEYVNNCESLENIFHDVLNKKCLLSWHLSVQS